MKEKVPSLSSPTEDRSCPQGAAPGQPRSMLAEDAGAVRILRLNRPAALNALTVAMEDELHQLLTDAEADPGVRVVVLTGEGRGFCSGADMGELESAAAGDDAAPVHNRMYPLSIRKPVIAAVNGPAVGIGLLLALTCDVRFAGPGAKFTTGFAQRGLIAELGVSWLLPRLVGVNTAMDLLLSSRTIDAIEASRIGLAHQVDGDVLSAALDYAQRLAANCSPRSMAVIKYQVYRHLDAHLAAAVAHSDSLMAQSLQWDDVQAGIEAFQHRRPATFDPLPERFGDVPRLTIEVEH